MNNITTKSKVYHGQADIDPYARYNADNKGYVASVPSVSLTQIKESYKEFLSDLLLESQEAY